MEGSKRSETIIDVHFPHENRMMIRKIYEPKYNHNHQEEDLEKHKQNPWKFSVVPFFGVYGVFAMRLSLEVTNQIEVFCLTGSWTIHLDDILLDVKCLHIAFKRARELNAFTGFRIRDEVTEVEQLAEVIGCGPSKVPFIYLGLPVRRNFIGFFQNPNALWVSVIRALHGHCGRLRDLSMVGAHFGPWKGIISALIQLKDRGDGLQEDFCQIRVGNGQLTDFWKDTWLGSTPLFLQFSRIFALDESHRQFSWQKRVAYWLGCPSLRRDREVAKETEQLEAISALIQAFLDFPFLT
ncbi:hypothetical protein Tco_0921776 [Tanacetum coccineum]